MTAPAPPPAPPDWTPGPIARALRVSPNTVRKWLDAGLLPCTRLPGSRQRRVAHADLMRFVRAYFGADAAARLAGGPGGSVDLEDIEGIA